MKIIIILAILIIIFAIVTYFTVRKTNKLFRKNIAEDIHDDIGSTLNSIKIFAHLADNTTDNHTYCNLIKQSVKEGISSVRDLLWVLDEKTNDVDDLVKRITQFGIPVTEACGIKFFVKTRNRGRIVKFNMLEKRNLLLIIKEAITNSIKYSSCSKIIIRIISAKKAKKISIQDDGIGMCNQCFKSGNGLTNIIERAGRIRFHIRIESAPSKGTQICLKSNKKFWFSPQFFNVIM